MKTKKITMLLAFFLFCTSFFAYALTDIKNSWAKEYIDYLSKENIIAGYPNGTFGPANKMTKGQFIKVAVSSFYDGSIRKQRTGENWAQRYYDKALELGYVKDVDLDLVNLDENINRGQIARILYNVSKVSDAVARIDEIAKSSEIKDYNSIPQTDQIPVLDLVYRKVISGYPDGTFKSENTARRDEVAALMYKFINLNSMGIYKEESDEIEDVDGENNDNGSMTNKEDKLIIIDGKPGKGNPKFTYIVDYRSNVEGKLKELEFELSNTLSRKDVNTVMAYVKLKKKPTDKLVPWSKKLSGVKVEVVAPQTGSLIVNVY